MFGKFLAPRFRLSPARSQLPAASVHRRSCKEHGERPPLKAERTGKIKGLPAWQALGRFMAASRA
tara:strand:+ start:6509 stop:6703 length:195 start_codon:yes stop_codon:yes gene_type:complete